MQNLGGARDPVTECRKDSMSISSHDRAVTMDNDSVVSARVSDFLRKRHFPSLLSLEIDVHEGALTLTGRVSSFL